MKTLVCYFSGTGNTQITAREIAGVLKSDLTPFETLNPESLRMYEMIGIGAPVHGFDLPVYVIDKINSFPALVDKKCFVFVTSGGFPGKALKTGVDMLEATGADVFASKSFKMPGNDSFLFGKEMKINDEKNKKAVLKAKEEAEKFAHTLTDSTASLEKINFFTKAVSSGASYAYRKIFLPRAAKKLKINNEKCSRCWICVLSCPVNNIEQNEYPEMKDKCFICARCINACPQKAIYYKKQKLTGGYRPPEV